MQMQFSLGISVGDEQQVGLGAGGEIGNRLIDAREHALADLRAL